MFSDLGIDYFVEEFYFPQISSINFSNGTSFSLFLILETSQQGLVSSSG